jgi:hypothetical protein
MGHTAVRVRPADVIDRLAQLGLEAEPLRLAVANGLYHRDTCTENDPAPLGGLLHWGKTLRSLRDALAARQWRRDRERGYETVVHPDGRVAIAVASGDERTGIANGHRHPRTKHPHGDTTAIAIRRNREPSLFPELDQPPAEASPRETWVLLYATLEDEVRCELSKPDALDVQGYVVAWSERIILPPITRRPTPDIADDDDDDSGDVVVEVKRRA